MSATDFYTITGADFRRSIARSRSETNDVSRQIREHFHSVPVLDLASAEQNTSHSIATACGVMRITRAASCSVATPS